MIDFNEVYTLLVVIEKAAAHGTRYSAIISAAQAALDAIANPPKEEEENDGA
jgi:hypothetical protein